MKEVLESKTERECAKTRKMPKDALSLDFAVSVRVSR